MIIIRIIMFIFVYCTEVILIIDSTISYLVILLRTHHELFHPLLPQQKLFLLLSRLAHIYAKMIGCQPFHPNVALTLVQFQEVPIQ